MSNTAQSRLLGIGIIAFGSILLLGHLLFYQSTGAAYPKAVAIATYATILGIGWTIESPPIPNQHPSRWTWGYNIIAAIVGTAHGLWWWFF